MLRSGGVQFHVDRQAEELRKRGYDVFLITPRPRHYKDEPPAGTIFVGNSAKLNVPISTSLELGMNLKRDTIDDMLLRYNFDLLHIHEPEVPILGAQIIAKATCPIVATFHAVIPDTPTARTLEAIRTARAKTIFSRINAVTAVSDVAADFIRKNTDNEVAIIPNALDLSGYKKQASKRNNSRIVYVGRLEKRKGVPYLLQAFYELQVSMPNAKLDIVGDGPAREKLEEYVAEHDVKNVTFWGFVSEAKKRELMLRADLFCSPAIYGESFGIVLIEAMAMGIVTVAGDNPGYASVMKGTGMNSLVNPRDIPTFARRMQLMLQDEPMRQLWRDWAAEYVKQFDMKKVVDSYEKIYKRLTRKK